jgi:hypothetical protein
MPKKISGKGRTSGATPVQPTKTVESSKVGGVDQVKSAERQTPSSSVGSTGQRITPEMREKIMQLIDEEADKMFGGPNGLPEHKKETLKGAVKMAIQAGVLEENES